MSPQYVGFVDAVKLFFSNYTNFKGRSTRSEFWWWMLATVIIGIVLNILGALASPFKIIMGLYSLGILVPSVALYIRRMHDVGKSGFWVLINLVPIVGFIVFVVFAVQPSAAANEWGEPAKN